jgi:hypothetical protein
MTRPALKAGLIGGIGAVVAALIGLIPLLGCVGLPLEWLVFLVSGVLAAAWLLPPRSSGRGAGEGALAGLISGIVSALARMLLAPVSLAASGGPEAILSQLPADQVQTLAQAGIDPRTFVSTGAVLGVGACCGLFTIVLALGLGALGGLIYAAADPGRPDLGAPTNGL